MADLADDASDAVRLTAEELRLTKAIAYLEALEDADAVHSAVTRVEGLVTSAQAAVTTTQTRIDEAAELVRRAAPIDPVAKAFQKAVRDADHAMPPNVATDADAVYFVVAGMGVTATTATGDDSVGNVAGFGKFAKSDKIAPAVMHEGWRGFVRERSKLTEGKATFGKSDDVTTSDRVTVYTTQTDPEDEYFAEFFKGVRSGESTALANGSITFEAGVKLPGTAISSGLPNAGDDITYTEGDANHPFPTGRNQLSGSYRGVPGKFECNTSCSAEVDDDGKITFGTGQTWTFIPDGNLEMVTVKGVIKDEDYLTLGHWVRTTTKATGPTYRVGVFVQNGVPAVGEAAIAAAEALDQDTVDLATGSATYVGPAVGLFSKREHAPGGDGAITMSGQFTADANLVANFGTTAEDLGSVNGTIDNFMHGDNVIDSDWEVSMRSQISTTDGTFSQAENASGTDGSAWAGSFYKPGAVRVAGEEARLPPGYVAGTFENDFDNGEVIGAFGAKKE